MTLKLPFKGRKRFRGELMAADERLARPARADGCRRGGEEARREPLGAGACNAARAADSGVAAPAAAEPAGDEKVLDFTLDEVREARLFPVIDFKGRPIRPAGRSADARRAGQRRDRRRSEPNEP